MSNADRSDEELLGRLRDLALVEIDALLAGAEDDHYAELITAYGEDLEDALGCARARMMELLAVAGGPDPMGLVEMPAEMRARDGGGALAERTRGRLRERAAACRALARIDDSVAQLLPRLFEADRRRVSPGKTRS